MEQQIPPVVTPQTDEAADIQKNKTMAMVAYIIFFIPLLTDSKDSPFARFHANQGLILWIFAIAANIVIGILSAILGAGSLTAALAVLSIMGILSTIVWIGYVVLFIIGIMNANNGKKAPLPVIGKLFTIIK